MDEALLSSPIGVCQISASEKGVCSIHFLNTKVVAKRPPTISNPHLLLALQELGMYFGGRLTTFTCAIDTVGTPFQRRVWKCLSSIPFGATRTYGQVAREIGQAKASRAVGGANHRNPVPIIVPCHRVVGGSNKLVGFAGGLWRKQWMLEHEGISLPLS